MKLLQRQAQDDDDEDGFILPLDHAFETSIDMKHQNPESDSLHIDLMRLMRQAGVVSCNEGSILEGFFVLKSYIGKIIEYLQLTKKNNFVDKDDIICAIKELRLAKLFSPSRLSELVEPKFKELHPQFKSQPSIPPNNFSDAIHEDVSTFFEEDDPEETAREEVSVEYNLCDYDTLVNDDTMADDITHFLNENNPSYNDSFIMNGHDKIGVYTPLIRSRCSSLYNDFFRIPEMRSKGLEIAMIRERLILKNFENICLDHDVVESWIENIYLGILENMFDQTHEVAKCQTLNALFSTWPLDVHVMYKNYLDDADTIQHQDGFSHEYLLDRYDKHDKCCTLNLLWRDDESKDFILFIPLLDEEYGIQQQNEQEHQNNNMDDHRELLRSKHRIECKVHKFILSSRSLYFKQLMAGTFSEKQVTEYNVSEFIKSKKTLQLFVYYLYHNYLHMPPLPHSFPDFQRASYHEMQYKLEESHQINTYREVCYVDDDDDLDEYLENKDQSHTMNEEDLETLEEQSCVITIDHAENNDISEKQNVELNGESSSIMVLDKYDSENDKNHVASKEDETTKQLQCENNTEKDFSKSPSSELIESNDANYDETQSENPNEQSTIEQVHELTPPLDVQSYLELFQAADFFMIQGLKDLAEHNIGQLICDENVIELLNLALENNNFSKLLTTIDAYLLSSSNIGSPFLTKNIASQEIMEYYHALAGPITRENVVGRLKYVFGVLNKIAANEDSHHLQNASDKCDSTLLHDFYVQRLASFHKQKLVWFVVRNFDLFSNDQVALRELSEIQCTLVTCQAKTNVLKVVEWLCDRYGYTFELTEHTPPVSMTSHQTEVVEQVTE